MTLVPPFPYYGGKRRWAEAVWKRFGRVTGYYEPFCGSLAVALGSPYGAAQREIVCDTDGLLCNFWRALQNDPEATAYWADWPTIHHDLTARHKWLIQWRREHRHLLTEDPNFYDLRVAGWWVWGISSWIGGQWCLDRDAPQDRLPNVQPHPGGYGAQQQRQSDQIPHIENRGGGRGVQGHRRTLPANQIPHQGCFPGGQGVQLQRQPDDQRPCIERTPGGRGVPVQRGVEEKKPHTGIKPGGRGVQVQRPTIEEKRPYVNDRSGGHGVQIQRVTTEDRQPHLQASAAGRGVNAQRNGARERDLIADRGERLAGWFHALAARLQGMVVLNRSWESCLTPTLMMDTPTAPSPPVAVFFDPPYRLGDRDNTVYHSDFEKSSDQVAEKSWRWALEHGDRYRIAYACNEGDIDVPDDWEQVTQSYGGIRIAERRAKRRELIVFSPACARERQAELL